MDSLAYAFSVIVICAGVVCAFGLALLGLAWGLHKTLRAFQVWHTLLLVVAVRLHGGDYVDRLFWNAIEERARKSDFAATTIVNFVKRHAPGDGSDV